MPTEEEIAKWNRVNKTLRTKVTEDVIQANREKQQQLKTDALTIAAAERQGRREIQMQKADDPNPEVGAWAKLKARVDNIVGKGQNGYDNFYSAISDQLQLAMLLHDAIRASDLPGYLWTTLAPFGGMAKNWAVDKFSTEPKPTLPTIQYSAEFEDNKIAFDPFKDLRRTDGQPLFTAKTAPDMVKTFPTMKEDFDVGIALWLGQHGYKPGAEPGVYLNMHDDAPLTKKQFEKLRDNPDEGLSLNAFFSKNLDLDCKYGQPAPTPSP